MIQSFEESPVVSPWMQDNAAFLCSLVFFFLPPLLVSQGLCDNTVDCWLRTTGYDCLIAREARSPGSRHGQGPFPLRAVR